MLSPNQLEKVIVEYVDNQSAQYAVMIDGKWGSGKTYLWKKHIAKTLEASGRKTIHISLFGIKDLKEVEKKIFNQVLSIAEVSDLGLKNLLSEAMKFWDSQDSGIDFGKTNFAPVFSFVSNATEYYLMQKMFFQQKDKYVLCFDDLERLDPNVDITQALGYVNQYVEHHTIKTVIICDEEQLKTKDPYSSWKEKLVGYTYGLSTSIEKMIDYYTTEYSELAKKLIRENGDLIVALIKNRNSNNIRTLDICLNNCRRVVSVIAEIDKDFQEYRAIIQFVSSLTIELKINLPAKDDLEYLSEWSKLGYNFTKTFGMPKRENDEASEKSYLSKFLDTYYYDIDSRSFLSGQVTSKAIFDYVVTGYLNLAALKTDVTRIVKNRITPEKIFLREHWLLEQEEFDDILQLKLTQLKNNQITQPTKILELAQKLFLLSREKLILQSYSDLKSIFNNSINRLLRTKKLEYEYFDPGDIRYSLYDSTGKSENNAEYKEIVNVLVEKNKEVYFVPIKQEAANLLEQLKVDFDNTINSVFHKRRLYSDRPFIACINIYQFKDLILGLKNRQLADLFQMFVKNSMGQRILGGHKEDLDNLVKLKNLLDTSICEHSKAPLTIKISLIITIRDEILAAIHQIKAIT